MSEISWARRYYWSLRRELWEHPAIYVAPVIAGVLAIVGFGVNVLLRMSGRADLSAVAPHADTASDFAAALVMFSTMAVAVFYCLDTLYGERRDRSILFWKSLPVSDLTTVLVKVTVPMVVLPLLTGAVTMLVLLLMMPFTHAPVGQISFGMFYHMFTVHSLWWAPFFGWMIFVSAWARRAPFVWAVVPVVAIALVERIALDSTHFVGLLNHRLNVSPDAIAKRGTMPIDPGTQLTPVAFLLSPGLWIGLAILAGFIAAAVALRRYSRPV